MQSKAPTVEQYLAELPDDRRAALQAVRKVILANIDPIYQERMGYGMMGYSVPHSVFPQGYHCDPKQPLPFAGLASQKNAMSLYLMGLYMQPMLTHWFITEWKKTGKKLDMGKSCIRFKNVKDLALDVIAEALRRMPAKAYIDLYVSTLDSRTKGAASSPARTQAAKKTSKTAPKKSVKKATRTALSKVAKKSAARPA